MQAINVTTSQTTIAPAGNRDFVHIYNASDTTVYVKYDGDSTAVTPSTGLPIEPGGRLELNNDGYKPIFTKAVVAIHDGSGNKQVLVQGV